MSIYRPQDLFKASDYSITVMNTGILHEVVGTKWNGSGHEAVVTRTITPYEFSKTLHEGSSTLIKSVLTELETPVELHLVAQILYPDFTVLGFSKNHTEIQMLMNRGVDVTESVTSETIDGGTLPLKLAESHNDGT